MGLEERSQKKNQGKKNLALKRKKLPERKQKEKHLGWKKKWPRLMKYPNVFTDLGGMFKQFLEKLT